MKKENDFFEEIKENEASKRHFLPIYFPSYEAKKSICSVLKRDFGTANKGFVTLGYIYRNYEYFMKLITFAETNQKLYESKLNFDEIKQLKKTIKIIQKGMKGDQENE